MNEINASLILGSVVVVAVVQGVFQIVIKVIDRIFHKQDKSDDLRIKLSEIDIDIKDLKTKVVSIEQKQKDLSEGVQSSLRNQINSDGLKAIENNCIRNDRLNDIEDMHEKYRKLGGNGHCDGIIERVKVLPIK